jgi:RimJ/RimL family protein N-acetyltransferase
VGNLARTRETMVLMRSSSPICRKTERLILEPIGPEHADEVWTLHQDELIASWWCAAWSKTEATRFCEHCAQGWKRDGVSKWIAHNRDTGALVGRGGLSRMAAHGDETNQIQALLTDPSWAQDRLEIGWALLSEFRGLGLATEIGREGLRFAFEVLGARSVISYTERHNRASRRVMERLGLNLRAEIRAIGLVEGDDVLHDDAPFAVYATR